MPVDTTITVNLLSPSSVFNKTMNVLPIHEEPPSTAALMQALANLDLITKQVAATQQLLQQCLQYNQGGGSSQMSTSAKSDDPPTSAVRFPEDQENEQLEMELSVRDLRRQPSQSESNHTKNSAKRYNSSRWQDSMPSLTQIDFEDESMRIQDLRGDSSTHNKPRTTNVDEEQEPFETSAIMHGDLPETTRDGNNNNNGEGLDNTMHEESVNNCFLPVLLHPSNTVHTQASNTSLTLSGNSLTDESEDDCESATGRGGDDDTVTSRPYDQSEDFTERSVTERSVSRSPSHHQLLRRAPGAPPTRGASFSKSKSFMGLPAENNSHNTPTQLQKKPIAIKARSQSMDMAPFQNNTMVRKAKSGAAIDELKSKSKSRRKIRRFFGSKGLKDKSSYMDESASSSRSMGSNSTGARRNATWNEMEESSKRSSPRRSKSMRIPWPSRNSAPRRTNSSKSMLRTTNDHHQYHHTKSSKRNKVTAQPKNTKSLNIFCSDMVSNDFINNKLEILKENTNIVTVELEDCLTTQNSSIPHCLKEIMEFGDRHWKEIRMVDELLDGWVYPDFCAWRNQFLQVLGNDNMAPVLFQTRISVADSLDRSSHSMSNKSNHHYNNNDDPTSINNGSHHHHHHHHSTTLTDLVNEFQKDLGIIKLVVTVTMEPSLEMIDAMTELLQQEDREWEDFVLNLGDEGERQVWSQGVQEAIENLEHVARAKGVTGPIHAP